MRPRLAAALASIELCDREALLLVGWGNLSYAEVAAVTDVPVGTVRSRLFRGRRLLQEMLMDYAQDAGYTTAAPQPVR